MFPEPVAHDPAVSSTGPSVPTAPTANSPLAAKAAVAPEDGVVLVPDVPAASSISINTQLGPSKLEKYGPLSITLVIDSIPGKAEVPAQASVLIP